MLTDAMMPEMDGFMLVEELRKEPRLAPRTIMMLTSADRQADAARCRRLGMAAYLVKPVKADELQIAILAAIGSALRGGAATEASRANSATSGATRGARLRILLAEDNPVNERVARHILQKADHSVLAVANGREAVAATEREEFDVVLMDVQMPEMDGFEATAEIRHRERLTGRHLPIVAMTAHAMKGDRERCLAAGMDDYVSKPVHPADLLRVIEKFGPQAAESAAATPNPTNEEPAIYDRRTALERVSGEEELLDEVTQLFLSDAPGRLAEIRAALEQGDPQRVQNAAHSLKGAAGYVGAERTSARARRLEELGRSRELTSALEEFRELEREIERLIEAIAASAPETQSLGN
jgi:two-component system, sensor histidine kinase and response regulator